MLRARSFVLVLLAAQACWCGADGPPKPPVAEPTAPANDVEPPTPRPPDRADESAAQPPTP